MTDPKGDRGKTTEGPIRPGSFLRVAERKRSGVVVRGAKLHSNGDGQNSHEIIVMPTTNLIRGEEDWAICFAVPTNTKGIKHIYGRQASDTRKLEGPSRLDIGNPAFGGPGSDDRF